MDEILATIRRIIAEDEQPGERLTAGRAAAGGLDRGAAAEITAGDTADEILELTEAINEDGTVRHLVPIGGTSRIAALREPAPATAQVEPAPEPAPSPVDAPSPPAAPAQTVAPVQAVVPEPAAAIDERLGSDWASTAAGAAFARLAMVPQEPRLEREIALGGADRTLEGVVPLPRIGPWRGQLDGLLLANEGEAARERLTLIRIFEELRGLGYQGGYDSVRRYAKAGVSRAGRRPPKPTFC